MKIYLCGGINSLTDDQAKGWREIAVVSIVAAGHGVLDPMRRDYRGLEDASVDPIVNGDLHDVIDCDRLLVNATRPSWGTAMELVYAKLFARPAICFVEPNRPVSPWLRKHSTLITDSLEAAIKAVIE